MEIRERIITEAFTLFIKYGVRGVTMDQLACELGISKRTLYENFEDKNTLLSEGIKHFRKIKHVEAMDVLKNCENVIESLYFIGRHGEQFRKKVNPLFFEDIRKFYPEIHSKIADKSLDKEYPLMETMFRKGITEGVFKKELNPDLIAAFWHQVMTIFMNEEMFHRERYTQKELLLNLIIPYLKGISTDKGQKLIEKYFENEINHN
jgi:TetR/AcrR family transcriptional regulator, cholesterol catabolism regulator